jgi:hypothetical protein
MMIATRHRRYDAGEVARRARVDDPRIANISMNVPMPSAKIADPGVVSSLNDVRPSQVDAGRANTAQMPSAPMHAADDLRGAQ